LFTGDEPFSRAGLGFAAAAALALLISSVVFSRESEMVPVLVPVWFESVPFILVVLAPVLSIAGVALSIVAARHGEDVGAWRAALIPSLVLLVVSSGVVFAGLLSG
jgi:hypothetical protein